MNKKEYDDLMELIAAKIDDKMSDGHSFAELIRFNALEEDFIKNHVTE